MNRRTVTTALAATAALAALAGISSSASATTPAPEKTASISGSARIDYAYSPNDDIRFSFDARAVPFSKPLPGLPTGLPTDARGTVKISHWFAAENKTVRAEGTVDCLVTGGRTASFTAVITRADPEVADWVGKRRGFSVYDGTGKGGDRDRFGFHWGVSNLDTDDKGEAVQAKVGTCMAPAPFAPVRTGGFTVRHADLPPLPAAAPTRR
ncbi:hypothetical protein OG883_27700 [Streptomyces sp. NBC_01142]|uniref:hypothetical protein n=1 Tax=Streptomyces sp. NBC_01142 TaxID=2975865 RepID=UPI00225A16E7|nr:hypothetical protein [Streptomyces sp. NBC_01142]MCX4823594.1 hypothetical protein [Streptomyces sp. NBC_01142]